MTTANKTQGARIKGPEDVCAVPCFKEELVAEIRGWMPDAVEIKKAAQFFAALSDPSRLRIILALSRGELCVCDVSHVVGLSVSATSHQLRVLRNLRLVSYRNDGKMAYYTLAEMNAVLPWIKQALAK